MKIYAHARSKRTGHAHTIADIDIASLQIEALGSGAVRMTATTGKLALFGHYTVNIDLSALEVISLHTGSTVGFLKDEIARLSADMAVLRAQMAKHASSASTPSVQQAGPSPDVRSSEQTPSGANEAGRNEA